MSVHGGHTTAGAAGAMQESIEGRPFKRTADDDHRRR
jgi:hypothetical protein